MLNVLTPILKIEMVIFLPIVDSHLMNFRPYTRELGSQQFSQESTQNSAYNSIFYTIRPQNKNKSDPAPGLYHDDVIKWKDFPRYWPFMRGIHRWPVNSPHKDGALMFSLMCTWINRWINNREAGDLRRHRTHYDVIVMTLLVASEPIFFLRKLQYIVRLIFFLHILWNDK